MEEQKNVWNSTSLLRLKNYFFEIKFSRKIFGAHCATFPWEKLFLARDLTDKKHSKITAQKKIKWYFDGF